jgi:hypothetical protein
LENNQTAGGTISYLSICEHKFVRHTFFRSDFKKLSRSTMAKATGPPLPLGNYPNAVDISQPNYAINSVTWLEPPKPFTENHMNTASMTIKTSNDLAYKSVKNATPGIRTSFLATMHMIIVSSSTLSGKDCDKTSQMS